MAMKMLLGGRKRPREGTSSTSTAAPSSSSSSQKPQQGGSTTAAANDSSASSNAPVIEGVNRSVFHYPSSAPFPTVIDESFPKATYQSRVNEVKTAIHWGQRKLFLSELQLLTFYCRRGVSYHIVYAGSAPGTHLKVLDDLFENRHTWELVDPGHFDRPVLEPLPNFTLRNEFCTNDVVYGIAADRMKQYTPALRSVYLSLTVDRQRETETAAAVLQQQLKENIGDLDIARSTHDIPSMYEPPVQLPHGLNALMQVAMEKKPLLFVSDVRSGSPLLGNFEEHVAENMRAQQAWTEILQGEYSLLKFRLPYTSTRGTSKSTWLREDNTVDYLNGEVLLPLWTRPTSTEGRLLVKAGALQRPWDAAEYENQCYFFNAVIRERVHFNHAMAPHVDLDNHFDSAAEVYVWCEYVRQRYGDEVVSSPVQLRAAVDKVVKLLSKECRGTFEGAIANRDRIIVDLAAGKTPSAFKGHHADDLEGAAMEMNQTEQQQQAASSSTEKKANWEGHAKALINAAKKERRRPVWLGNVTEASGAGASVAQPATGGCGEEEELLLKWKCVPLPQ